MDSKLIIILLAVIIFLLYLIHERILLTNRVNSIPLRICVTGTRGKSSVVRLFASILREDGRQVLAKTTGAQAQILLPDGKEIDIPRRGQVTVMEQKNVLKKAEDAGADCIVAEIMSIHPENHYIEAQQILKPNIVAITNVRRDHTDAMGKTEEEMTSVFCLDIPAKAKVFIPEKESRPLLLTAVQKAGGELIKIREGVSSPLLNLAPELSKKEFSDHMDLVYALGKYLDIDQKVILNGTRKAKYDIGKFKIWKYRSEETQKTYYFVNGFAANDPESTFELISKVKQILPSVSGRFVGLLSLRSDRGDRTVQWVDVLKHRGFDYFRKIYLLGAHAKIVKRKVTWVNVLKNSLPEKMMETILTEIEDQTVILGFGNMGGVGRRLVDYWNRIGEDCGL